jgi:hypothetical protein
MARRGWVIGAGSSFERSAACALSVALLAACSVDDTAGTSTDDWAARIGAFSLDSSVISVGLGADPDGTRALRNFVLATALRTSEAMSAEWLRRSALAHAMADEVALAAKAQGPVTDEELASWTSAYWLGVDRPAAFRTTHAIVLSDAKAPEADKDAARALAERVRSAVVDAATLDDFRAKVAAIPAQGLAVKIEDLEPVAADGRVVRLGSKIGAPIATYDEAFAKAASALSRIGETSPVVTSSFGYHVLRLVDVIPELRFDADERRLMALRDVYDLRARNQLDELVANARKQESASVERSAEEATARVSVD